jgi:hypothetical protein
MERTSKLNPIRRVLREVPRGTLLAVADLKKHGIDAKAASSYARKGWLDRVGQGVYSVPGDSVTTLGAMSLLQRQVPGLHIGGKSALALHGFRHNLAVRDTLVLWANGRFTVPRWLAERFPARAVYASLFQKLDPSLVRKTLGTPPDVLDGVQVSSPERAVLEMLYEVGTHESLEEARNVFDGLRNLRNDVVGGLLAACKSIKAVRLFLAWSRETGLVDVDVLRKRFDLRVGSASRWVTRLPDGTLLLLKQYG